VHYVRTFADAVPDELLLYEDAQRRLAVAVNHGNAATRLGLAVDDELGIRPG
jgi:S-adenosylmethionine hydrolase